jgi:arabinoxylan arabinofuranohydrolase
MNKKYSCFFQLAIFVVFIYAGCNRDKPLKGEITVLNLKTGGNPVITEGSADPSVRVFDDRVYIYPSHDFSRDNNFWIMKDWKVYSSDDLINFTDHGVILKGEEISWAVDPDHCWAPDCVEKSGRYYFYFPLSDKAGVWKGKIGVAVAEKPFGSFRDALGYPLIDDHDKPADYEGGFYNIDPVVFIDEGGKSYLFWGNGACFMAELNEDMISLKSEIYHVDIKNNRGYMEGPFVWKRKGIYYLLYSRMGSSGKDVLDYATSHQVGGPYHYRGTIIGHGLKGNEHGSVFQYRGQWYVAYHDLFPTDKFRKTCLEIIHYRENGEIVRVQPSREGVGWYNASEKIEAEDYFEKSADIEYKEHDDTGFYMDHLRNGSWLKFPNVNLAFNYGNHFSAQVAAGGEGGNIEIITDSLTGGKAGELRINNTGNWNSWQTLSTMLDSISDTRDIFLRFTGKENELFNLDFFRFY